MNDTRRLSLLIGALSSRVGLRPGAALLLVACSSEQTLAERDARIEVSPTLLDFSDVSVGGSDERSLTIDHLDGGEVRVRTISVTNQVGDYFSYEGEPDLTLEPGGRLLIPITYRPLAEGWHQAQIKIIHTGLGDSEIVDVRAHAVLARATLDPLVLDFGAVVDGASVTRSFVLSNTGGVPLIVGSAALSVDAFELTTSLPVELEPGQERTLNVRFTAEDTRAVVGNLTLSLGEVGLPKISLRANDCESGIPEAYDTDADGFTSCAGDCDDGDPDVHPGAVEVTDGTDQDCDDTVDEGTLGYDDDGDGVSEDRGDCHDGDPDVSPEADEVPDNGVDDDCDGVVDTGLADLDADGFAVSGGDCADNNAARHPGAVEVANGVDDDCDGLVDDGTVGGDDDGDGFSENTGDCDDSAASVHPGAAEVGNGVDDDCDGAVDDGTDRFDDDGDGYTELGGDCDDADADLSPGLGTC